MINLGDKVQDKVSGIIGIATSRTEYLNGCIQFAVMPKVDPKKNDIQSWNIDEGQLKVISSGLKKVPKKRDGGPTRRA